MNLTAGVGLAALLTPVAGAILVCGGGAFSYFAQ
jgi:hypothetical protein